MFQNCGAPTGLRVQQAASVRVSDPEIVAITPEVGGSNFLTYDLNQAAPLTPQSNWNAIKWVLRDYDVAKPTIDRALQRIFDSKQRIISLMIWHVNSCEDVDAYPPSGLPCEGWDDKHNVLPTQSQLHPRIRANLVNYLRHLDGMGWNAIVIRFGPQWRVSPFDFENSIGADPNLSPARKEELFQKFNADRLAFTFHVRDVVAGLNLRTPVWWDLGAEGIGHPMSLRTWVRRALIDTLVQWNLRYGVERTFGFSYNMNNFDSAAVTDSLRVYAEAGFIPPRLAFDIYDDPERHFQMIQQMLSGHPSFGSRHPIVVLETFQNHQGYSAQFIRAQSIFGLNLRYIVQWPILSAADHHFSVAVPDTFDQYLIR